MDRAERGRHPAYPFPLKVPKHPANEAPPTCNADFVGQIRTFVSVPGFSDGIYCCQPGASAWQQIASLPLDDVTIEDSLSLSFLAGSGDRIVQVAPNGGIFASAAMTGTGDGFVMVASDGSLFRDDGFPIISTRTGLAATITAGSSNTATATCDAGEISIAGGCMGETSLVFLYRSERSSTNAWICGGRNTDAVNRTLEPTVVCLVNPQ